MNTPQSKRKAKVTPITGHPIKGHNRAGDSAFDQQRIYAPQSIRNLSEITTKCDLLFFSYAFLRRRIVALSGEFKKILGVEPRQILLDGSIFFKHIDQDERYDFQNRLEHSLTTGEDFSTTYRWIRPDNDEARTLMCRAKLCTRKGEKLLEGCIVDISHELVNRGGMLHQCDSPELLLSALDSSSIVLDHALRIVRLSLLPNFHCQFGDPHFAREGLQIGTSFLRSFSNVNSRKEFATVCNEVLNGEAVHDNRPNQIREDLRIRKILYGDLDTTYCVTLRPLLSSRGDTVTRGILLQIEDDTAAQEQREELLRLRKSDTARQLFSATSHNLSNTLQAVLGFASTIASEQGLGEEARSAAGRIIEAVKQASSLLSETVRAEPEEKKEDVDLNLLLASVLREHPGFFAAGAPPSIVFGNLPSMRINAERTRDLLHTILAWVRTFIAGEHSASAARICIKTHPVNRAEIPAAQLLGERFIKLSICDDTNYSLEKLCQKVEETIDPYGLDAEDETVASPSFSLLAKKLKRLSCSIIIEKSGKRSSGLVFLFPAVPQLQVAPQPRATLTDQIEITKSLPIKTPEATTQLKEQLSPQVVVVDDDELVRETLRALLHGAAVTCFITKEPEDALKTIRMFTAEIKLVLVDAIMPGIDTASFIRSCKAIRADLKVVLFSGAPDELIAPLLSAGASHVLRKPLDSLTLQGAVRELVA